MLRGEMMYKNRAGDGRCNLCGKKIALLRKEQDPPLSQRALADRLQLAGIDLDKNAIQRIESGQRFVIDLELKALAQILHTTMEALVQEDPSESEVRFSENLLKSR